MHKLEEQEMKKIWSIKQNVMGEKPKIIRDKVKDKVINDIWILFETKKRKRRQKKKGSKIKIIKDKIIRDVRTLFEQQEEDYHHPKRVSNFCNNNHIEYESNGDANKNLSLDVYLHKIKPYLRNIIINLQNSDAWKIQLTIAINFISSKDVEEECVFHSNSGNIKFAPYSNANDIIDKLFNSIYSIYQENLETSMKGSDFVFDSVQVLYYKCRKVNFSCVVRILILQTG